MIRGRVAFVAILFLNIAGPSLFIHLTFRCWFFGKLLVHVSAYAIDQCGLDWWDARGVRVEIKVGIAGAAISQWAIEQDNGTCTSLLVLQQATLTSKRVRNRSAQP